MRIWLLHYLHPVNLWSRLGGRYKPLFELYERCLWQSYLRSWLNGKEVTESKPICEVESYGRKGTSRSTGDKTESSNSENTVFEQPKETGVPTYPDWTPFEFFG